MRCNDVQMQKEFRNVWIKTYNQIRLLGAAVIKFDSLSNRLLCN